ncbi:hypothetical protein FGIG_00603 [Fasciola gigantica]|uniref:Uncharacterized protein n=1 Tax=Fasciola gigantica TaxID=46835 RepID=A0A504YVK7_FASGI|nr:hypothetical protein FGIG_00603 [Fasciola gigantica]
MGWTSQLTASDSRAQRHLLLASILEYVAQLTVVGVLEPTTLPEAAGGDPTGTYNLTRLIELLASVTETNTCHSDELTKGSTILTVLLGTTEAPSSAVSSLLLSPMPLAASGATVYSTPLPASLLPTPTQAIDLALVLLIRMANGVVSRTTGRTGTGASGLNPAVVATVQNAIKLFLSQWFTEYMRDKELADSFAYGIVDYLRLRYTPHVIGSSVPSSNVRCASSISALPGDLRKPSQALLTHIICSAQAALK